MDNNQEYDVPINTEAQIEDLDWMVTSPHQEEAVNNTDLATLIKQQVNETLANGGLDFNWDFVH